MKTLLTISTLVFTVMFSSTSYAGAILVCNGTTVRDSDPLKKEKERKSFIVDLEKKFVETDYGKVPCDVDVKRVYCHSDVNRDYVHQLKFDRLSGDVSQQYRDPKLNLYFSFDGICTKKQSVF